MPLVRQDRRRTLRFGLYVANLAFRAGAAGKEPELLEEQFGSVADAAKAYLDAYPTAATLEEICEYRIHVRQRRHVSDGCPPIRLDGRG